MGLWRVVSFRDVVTYSVVFRTYEGIRRWMKIGRHGVFTPDQARQEAARLLREVALGKDVIRRGVRTPIVVATR
jgi:hypothetical protein